MYSPLNTLGQSYEIMEFKKFAFIMQISKGNKYWHTVELLQNILFPLTHPLKIHRLKFVLSGELFRDPLFERAKLEALNILEHVPQVSDLFLSIPSETQYMRALESSNHNDYCRYTIYKIYHLLEKGVKISLRSFLAEFCEAADGGLELYNIVVFDAVREATHNSKFVSEKTLGEDVLKVESEVMERVQRMIEDEKARANLIRREKRLNLMGSLYVSEDKELRVEKRLDEKIYSSMRRNFDKSLNEFVKDSPLDNKNSYDEVKGKPTGSQNLFTTEVPRQRIDRIRELYSNFTNSLNGVPAPKSALSETKKNAEKKLMLRKPVTFYDSMVVKVFDRPQNKFKISKIRQSTTEVISRQSGALTIQSLIKSKLMKDLNLPKEKWSWNPSKLDSHQSTSLADTEHVRPKLCKKLRISEKRRSHLNRRSILPVALNHTISEEFQRPKKSKNTGYIDNDIGRLKEIRSRTRDGFYVQKMGIEEID